DPSVGEGGGEQPGDLDVARIVVAARPRDRVVDEAGGGVGPSIERLEVGAELGSVHARSYPARSDRGGAAGRVDAGFGAPGSQSAACGSISSSIPRQATR